MTSRPVFLTKPYSAYAHTMVPKEDAELSHVGPGTPCGEYLRRFWQPVCLTSELTDLPLAIKIMGEDLVVFRDFRGQIGCLELHCPHRGTSLEYGLVSEQGIRCCYHGWLFDTDGTILETPGEPAESTLKDRLCQGAYPTHEYKGLVFAYMGPANLKPPFPIYDSYNWPGTRTVASHREYNDCNWLQIKENCMDPVHLSFLHTRTAGAQFTDEFGILAELDFIDTPVGLSYIATRRVDDNLWLRMAEFMRPNIHQFGANMENGRVEHPRQPPIMCQWAVPIDDVQTVKFSYRIIPDGMDDIPSVVDFGQVNDRPYEERQRIPGDYDALAGQRKITVHDLEHLATSDVGVILFRNFLRKEIRELLEGQEPMIAPVDENGITRTNANDTVLRLPAAPTELGDIQLIRETGRKIAEGYIKNPPLLPI